MTRPNGVGRKQAAGCKETMMEIEKLSVEECGGGVEGGLLTLEARLREPALIRRPVLVGDLQILSSHSG
jgi:hypothetical protein